MRTLETEILVKSFFEGWQLYTIAIENDYMIHRKIIEVIQERMGKLGSVRPQVLEVGCGDAHVLSEVAKAVPIGKYHGIDLSSKALDHARHNLAGVVDKSQLFQGNMDEILPTLTDTYDFVLAGYTLHHFRAETKTQLFRQFRRLLKAHGKLIVYDIIHEPGEDRERFLSRATDYFDAHWKAFSKDQLRDIRNHVSNNDYPESWEHWWALALAAGFAEGALLHRDKNRLFGIMEFW